MSESMVNLKKWESEFPRLQKIYTVYIKVNIFNYFLLIKIDLALNNRVSEKGNCDISEIQ